MLIWKNLNTNERLRALARPAQANDEAMRLDVQRLINQVRADGDHTLRALTRRFDGAEVAELQVSQAEIDASENELSNELKQAMQAARARIHAFHQACAPQPVVLETSPGVLCERIPIGIETVGLYVPAGSAPLPSTALMLAVPANLASCANIVICSPPNKEGKVHPTVLYAAKLCGVKRVYKLGGVQAIAAMAYGSESVPKCDKIFGPGNSWVTLAKQLVSSDPAGAAIDMPAGPSEVLVIADQQADAAIVAADLLSQAEHGPDSQVVLISDSQALLDSAQIELQHQLIDLPRADIAKQAMANSRFVLVDDLQVAIDVSNQYAPEHLILNVRAPRSLLSKVRNAGSVFMGELTPESTGDYNAGTNHVLPTYGYAKAYSGVSVASFQKLVTVQTLTQRGLTAIGPEAIVFARAEGLEAHARAVQIRLERFTS
jgi:histidinol dehydrogenase